VVQVEQRSLRALEEHTLSAVHLGIQIRLDIGKKWHDLRGEFEALVSHGNRIKRCTPKQRGGNAILFRDDLAAAAAEQLRAAEVPRPQPAATRFILVGRANPLGRRADFPYASRLFRGNVVSPMVRQYKVSPVADHQASVHTHTVCLNGFNLTQQSFGINYDPVSDDRGLVLPHDACGEKLEDILLAANVDGMARIRAALVSSHDVKVLGQSIDDFALAFVAPLSAHDNYVCWHVDPLKKPESRSQKSEFKRANSGSSPEPRHLAPDA